MRSPDVLLVMGKNGTPSVGHTAQPERMTEAELEQLAGSVTSGFKEL